MNAKIVAICLTAFLYVAVSAQNFWDEFRTKSLDVEGVKIGQKMTYDKFVAKSGSQRNILKVILILEKRRLLLLMNITGLGKMCFILGIMGVFVGFP